MQDYTNSSTNNGYDYRYLTTYLYSDTASMANGAESFDTYKFQIQSAAPTKNVVVELGGTKIGPKQQ